jgi:hypothetical protein
MNKATPISAFESPLATALINFGNVPHLLVRRVACSTSGSVEVTSPTRHDHHDCQSATVTSAVGPASRAAL